MSDKVNSNLNNNESRQLFVQDDELDEELRDGLLRQVEELKQNQQNVQEPDEEDMPVVSVPTAEAVDEAEERGLKPNFDDIRPVDINLSVPLLFQQQIIESVLVSEDPLVLLGKGLGAINLVANLLHILATPTKLNGELKRSLVLVLNAKPEENKQLAEDLLELYWLSNDEDQIMGEGSVQDDSVDTDELNSSSRPFNVVTADSLNVEKRRQLYLSGGIISVTSRILIVDLLSGIIHPNRITGMVVLNVENLRHFSNESFIIEMYRTKNKWGFVKAFSENAESFVMDFSPLMKKMKDLRLKNVLLWPRFRVEISSCLNNQQVSENSKVIEVRIGMTNSMSQIQYGLIECLKKCIDELNRKNHELSKEWWTIENAFDVNFQRSIDAVMMPNWHRISYESKQLIKDIRFLRNLTRYLTSVDAVDFYEEIQLSLEANKPSISKKYSESPWLMAEESQIVIAHSRKRLYDNSEYQLEELPKWEQLIDVLKDIEHERLENNVKGVTLIVCSDNKTCRQLTNVVRKMNKKNGLKEYMQQKLTMYKYKKEERKRYVREVNSNTKNEKELTVSAAFAKEQVLTKRRRTRGASAVAAVERLYTSGAGEDIEEYINQCEIQEDYDDIDYYNEMADGYQESVPVEEFETQIDHEPVLSSTKLSKEFWDNVTEKFSHLSCSDQIIIQSSSRLTDESMLQEMMPSYIIIYEPDLTFIRKVEIYRAINKELAPKVFFLYYGDSIEEQRYLTAIKKEKDAFTKLIKENAMLASHYETEGDLSHFKNLADRKLKLSSLQSKSTRIAGGQASLRDVEQDVVIVDSREFNASLPGLLFRYGVCVVPCMLTVGDYIISPEICIERKSIADLIGSLQNNRLDSQCKKMCKFYKYPTLLIEFEENQSFSLEPFSEKRSYRSKDLSTVHSISDKLSQDEVQMKLCKLIMKFPNLKIIWSSSPLQTVNIILELKIGRSQPDPNESIAVGLSRSVASSKPQSLSNEENFLNLLKIPSISKVDYFNIRKKIKSYQKLVKLSSQALFDLLGDEGLAETVYAFIHNPENNNDTPIEDD